MKNVSFFKLLTLPLITGLILTLSFCKKDTETLTVTETKTETITKHDTVIINDTLRIYVTDSTGGKSIKGNATYLDMLGITKPAAGAVLFLYYGNSVNANNLVYTSTADANGNFEFKFLAKNTYFLFSKYNTDNKNYRVIDGINFQTDPGYVISMVGSDFTQNVDLKTLSSSGTSKISLDTIVNGYRKVTFNTHSKVVWESLYNGGNSQTIQGAFNTLQITKFDFDETDVSKINFSGYVLLSSLTTFEPARDALGTGCVSKTMRVDTLNATTPLAETDTAKLYTVSVEKYGDGYLAHCMMKAFYMTGPSTPQTYAIDTTGIPSQYWGTTIEKPIDVFITFEKKKVFNAAGTTFNWEFIFEAMFTFKAKTDYYVSSNNIGDAVTVKPHILMRGANNVEY